MLRAVEGFMLFGFIFNLDRVTSWFKDPHGLQSGGTDVFIISSASAIYSLLCVYLTILMFHMCL